MLKAHLQHLKDRALASLVAQSERSLLLQGVHACHTLRSLGHLQHLSDAEFRVHSQWGEDGILEWLIQRLPICSTRFIEFGVEDYREANTRFLLVNRDWKGLVLDGSEQNMQKVRAEDIYWRHDLTAISAFITRDNINRLIGDNGYSGSLGLLSIDIDGNDYWVWESLDSVNADIVVCEYNAVLGDLHAISIPYGQHFFRTKAHSSNLYFGASIGALCFLARRKGYELIGTNRAGCNAFFVRKELFPLVDANISDKSPRPSHARESRDTSGALTFVSGLERLKVIEDMPVVRVDTGETIRLGTLGTLYSKEWLGSM